MALPSDVPAFIPVQLPTPDPAPVAKDIKVEIRKGALTMSITWLARLGQHPLRKLGPRGHLERFELPR